MASPAAELDGAKAAAAPTVPLVSISVVTKMVKIDSRFIGATPLFGNQSACAVQRAM
ncbi:hypothetical protein ABNG03_07490 [Halorubrum sp. RMP-47]|uniref:hypothetical protein n=1 Tax=Halorubrum miltondacostae TaxID=3076378 RepID=UPI0035297723